MIKNIAVLVILVSAFGVVNALSPAERWALALTEIMTVVNGDSHDTLNFGDLSEKDRIMYINTLKRDWGISSREDLLSMIEEMEVNGHSVEFEKMKLIISSTTGYSDDEIKSKYKLSPKQYNYFKYVKENWDLLKDRRILVWDYGRNICLCRWGYDCGYLSEKEAWEKIMYYAKKIQPMYKSWKEYGFDYYMGRVFWASGFSEEKKYRIKTKPILLELISKKGYWSSLKWDEILE